MLNVVCVCIEHYSAERLSYTLLTDPYNLSYKETVSLRG